MSAAPPAAARPGGPLTSPGGAGGWLGHPRLLFAAAMMGGTAFRVAAALLTDLGVDESYQLVQGRHLQLSYFDHPPGRPERSAWLTPSRQATQKKHSAASIGASSAMPK